VNSRESNGHHHSRMYNNQPRGNPYPYFILYFNIWRIADGQVYTSETPKLRSNNEALFSGLKPKLSTKNEESENEKSNSLGNKFVSNYDARVLRKPPSSNSTSKHMKHNTLTKRPSKKPSDGRRTNVSMERKDLIKPLEVDNEAIKRYKVQEQIMNHINSGKLVQESIITPIISNDGTIRQYIINDPISNPEEIEAEIPLLSGNRITNTTVDKSK
jgi:hypothetical protein